MVYNYYMKNFYFRTLAVFLFSLFSLSLSAQITVVRVEGNKVFMDISSAATRVQEGDLFKVILSSETLTNPKTGKELGLVHSYSSEGKITKVEPLFAVGELPKKESVSVGQEVILSAGETTIVTQKESEITPAKSTHTSVRYNPIDQTVISLTEGNFPQHPNTLVTLSEKGVITLWERGENQTLNSLLSYDLPATKKGITISAKDVKNTGSDQLFVSVYDQTRQSVSTLILEVQGNALTQIASMPNFVKELGCGNEKTVWSQRPFVTSSRPGNAKDVVYKKNKFTTGDQSFATQHNWLLGLNIYPIQNETAKNLIYTSANGKLRMVLENDKRTDSSGDFGSTPNRIQYKQEIIRFFPSLQVYGPHGNAQIAAVENTAKIGLLSNTFGQYQDGKIHFLVFEQGRLKTAEILNLEGVLYDTSCTDESLLTAAVLADGTSSIVEISK